MRKPIVKENQLGKMKQVMRVVFNDGKTKGLKARQAKQYFAEVLLNSL